MMLSSTRVRMILTCPRQFRYAYLDEIPTLPSLPLVFGQVVHKVLHRTHDRALELRQPFDSGFAIAEFGRLWREALEANGPLLPDGKAGEPDYPELAQQMLSGYAASPLAKSEPMVLEVAFEMEWKGHSICGVIDRIDQGEDGLTVVDYKSGKRKPSPNELDADLQLTLYAWAAERLLQEPVAGIVYYFLRRQMPLTTRRAEEDFRALEEVILPRVVETVRRGEYPPRYGFWCRFCDFRELCAAEDEDAMPASVIDAAVSNLDVTPALAGTVRMT